MWCQRWDPHGRCPLVSPVRGALLFPTPAATQTQPPGPPLPPALRLNRMSSCNYTNRGLAATRVWPGNRTCHPSVSQSQEIPLPLGLGSFLFLHFRASPSGYPWAQSGLPAIEHSWVFVRNYERLGPAPEASNQNKWGWGSGACISSRASVDSYAHPNLGNIGLQL